MSIDTPVVIVGAGLSGLVAADALARDGVESVVLEASERVGGRVHSIEFEDGVTAEAHMEEFWEGSPAWRLLHELNLPLDLDVAHSSVIIDGQLHVYQGDGARDDYLNGIFDNAEQDAFTAFSRHVGEVLTWLDNDAHQIDMTPWVRPLMYTDLASYVLANVKQHRVAEWIRIVVESETAIAWDELSALDGIAELRPFVDRSTGFGEANAHVRGGNERFTDALASRLPAGSVRTGARVERICDLDRWCEVSYRTSTGTLSTLRSERVAIALPHWALKAIDIEGHIDQRAQAALDLTRCGRYVKVLLRLRPEARELWSAHGDRLFTLLTDSAAGCVYAATPNDHDSDPVMTLLVHGSHAKALNGLPSDAIVARALADLSSVSAKTTASRRNDLFPQIASFVKQASAYDYPQAVGYWPVAEGRSRFDALAQVLREPQGRLHFAGDTTESSHSDGAVRSALRVSGQIAVSLGLRAEEAS